MLKTLDLFVNHINYDLEDNKNKFIAYNDALSFGILSKSILSKFLFFFFRPVMISVS